VDMSYGLFNSVPFGTPLRMLFEPALGPGQVMLVYLKESLSWNFESIAGHDIGFQTHIQSRDLTSPRHGYGFIHLNGKGDKPLISSGFQDGTSFNFTKTWSMKYNRDATYFTKINSRIGHVQIESILFIGHGIISTNAFEAWVSGLEPLLTSPKEGFVCKVHTELAVLEDLGMDGFQSFFIIRPCGKILI